MKKSNENFKKKKLIWEKGEKNLFLKKWKRWIRSPTVLLRACRGLAPIDQ